MTRVFRDPRAPVRIGTDFRARIDALRALWHAKRGERRYPSRSDFDLPDLAPWLRNVEIVHVEREPDGRVRYRYGFVGSAINTIDGVSITGRYADELFSDIYDSVMGDYDRVLADREPLERFFEEMVNNRGSLRTYCKLTLPLADDGATIDALLVLLVEVEAP